MVITVSINSSHDRGPQIVTLYSVTGHKLEMTLVRVEFAQSGTAVISSLDTVTVKLSIVSDLHSTLIAVLFSAVTFKSSKPFVENH